MRKLCVQTFFPTGCAGRILILVHSKAAFDDVPFGSASLKFIDISTTHNHIDILVVFFSEMIRGDVRFNHGSVNCQFHQHITHLMMRHMPLFTRRHHSAKKLSGRTTHLAVIHRTFFLEHRFYQVKIATIDTTTKTHQYFVYCLFV
jgi:hypothetical protein